VPTKIQPRFPTAIYSVMYAAFILTSFSCHRPDSFFLAAFFGAWRSW